MRFFCTEPMPTLSRRRGAGSCMAAADMRQVQWITPARRVLSLVLPSADTKIPTGVMTHRNHHTDQRNWCEICGTLYRSLKVTGLQNFITLLAISVSSSSVGGRCCVDDACLGQLVQKGTERSNEHTIIISTHSGGWYQKCRKKERKCCHEAVETVTSRRLWTLLAATNVATK